MIIRETLHDEVVSVTSGSSKTFTHTDDVNKNRELFIEKKIPGGVSSMKFDGSVVSTFATSMYGDKDVVIYSGSPQYTGESGLTMSDIFNQTPSGTYGGLIHSASTTPLGEEYTIYSGDDYTFVLTDMNYIDGGFGTCPFELLSSIDGINWTSRYENTVLYSAADPVNVPLDFTSKYLKIKVTTELSGNGGYFRLYTSDGTTTVDLFDMTVIGTAPLTTTGETVLTDSIPLVGTQQLTQTDMVSQGATTSLSFDGGTTYGEFSADHGIVSVPAGSTDLMVKTLVSGPSSVLLSKLSIVSSNKFAYKLHAYDSNGDRVQVKAFSFVAADDVTNYNGNKTVTTPVNTAEEIAQFDFSAVTLGDSLDVKMLMTTDDTTVTPSVDQITVNMETNGVWAHTVPNPDTILVYEEGTNDIVVTNLTNEEKTLKVNVEV